MKIYDYTDENITQAILDSLTRIPPISPEAAVHRLVVQECPISPSTITDYQDDSLEDEQMVTTHHDLPNVSTPDTKHWKLILSCYNAFSTTSPKVVSEKASWLGDTAIRHTIL